tara:strand:+ start:1462 stop:1854 length:393 start_codon:yes stop_codon:yes gene_type:complete
MDEKVIAEGIVGIGRGFCFSKKRLFIYKNSQDISVPLTDISDVHIYIKNSWGFVIFLAIVAFFSFSNGYYILGAISTVLGFLSFKYLTSDNILIYENGNSEPYSFDLSRKEASELKQSLGKLEDINVIIH